MFRSTRRDAARRVDAHVRNTEISLSFYSTPQASQEIYDRRCRESSARPLFYRTSCLQRNSQSICVLQGLAMYGSIQFATKSTES